MNEETKEFLRPTAIQLERWAKESLSGGWSTHQVKPMQKKADEIWAFIGKHGK